jgi:hypothetical protein
MAIQDNLGEAGFDGFVVGSIVAAEVGPNGGPSEIDVAVAVAFDAAVSSELHLVVGPHGPRTDLDVGRTYFLTLHHVTDPELTGTISVHPCGPAYELRSAGDLDTLLRLSDDEIVVDPALLAQLQIALPRPSGTQVLLVPVVLAGLVVAAAAIFLTLRGPRQGARAPGA